MNAGRQGKRLADKRFCEWKRVRRSMVWSGLGVGLDGSLSEASIITVL